MMKVKSKVWLEKNGELVFGVGKRSILTAIQLTGSINKAAKKMNMSYRRAWSYVISVEKRIGRPLLIREKGGKDGEAVLEKLFSQQTNRKNFVLARVTKKLGQYYLSPLSSHGSADVVSLSQADGFFIADKDVVTMKKNARVKFITWKII